MFAFVQTAQGAPEKLDSGVAVVRDQLEAARSGAIQVTGMKEVYVLIDRTTGKQIAISLWETREDAEQARTISEERGGAILEAFGITGVADSAVYEVAIHP